MHILAIHKNRELLEILKAEMLKSEDELLQLVGLRNAMGYNVFHISILRGFAENPWLQIYEVRENEIAQTTPDNLSCFHLIGYLGNEHFVGYIYDYMDELVKRFKSYGL